MEDNYSSLGIFANLSSVKAVKKLALAPPPPATQTVVEQTLSEELDSFLDIEKSVCSDKSKERIVPEKKSTSKKPKRTASKGNDLTNTSQGNNQEISLEVSQSETNISRCTRSSKRTNITPSQPSVLTKSKRTTGNKKSSVNKNSPNNQITSSNPPARTGRRRGRPKSANTSLSQNATVLENVVIGDAESPSQNQSIRGAQSFGIPNGQTRDVMRARRDYIAERAARCTTVDFVDLISSPLPRIQGVIDVTLDSDEEKNTGTAKSSTQFDMSFDEENPEISVKIMWNGTMEFFTVRKYQKFDNIFEKLAERSAIEKKNIFLNLENKIISQNDTPASINYKIYQLIYGRSMVHTNFEGVSALGKKKRDPNLLKLKVQSDKWKRPLNLELYKTENFKKLIIKCAEELKMPYEKIKLSFDGEPLQHDQTPTDLEFEGGEVLEIHLTD